MFGIVMTYCQYVWSFPIWSWLHDTTIYCSLKYWPMWVKHCWRLTFDVTFYHPISVSIKHVVYCCCDNSAWHVELKRYFYVLKQPRVGESYTYTVKLNNLIKYYCLKYHGYIIIILKSQPLVLYISQSAYLESSNNWFFSPILLSLG